MATQKPNASLVTINSTRVGEQLRGLAEQVQSGTFRNYGRQQLEAVGALRASHSRGASLGRSIIYESRS